MPTLRRLWAGESLSDKVGAIGPALPRAGGPEMSIGGYVPAIVAAHRQVGRRLHGAGRRRARKHAQDVAADIASVERSGRSRPAVLGRRDLLLLGRKRVDHATAYINANYGYNPDLATRRLRTCRLPKIRGNRDQTPSRHGRGRVHHAPCAENLDQMDLLAELAARPESVKATVRTKAEGGEASRRQDARQKTQPSWRQPTRRANEKR